MGKLTQKEEVLLTYYSQYIDDPMSMTDVHLKLLKEMDYPEYKKAMIQLDNEMLMDGINRFPQSGSPVPGIKVEGPMITPEGIRVIESLLNIDEKEKKESKFSKIKDSVTSMATDVIAKVISDQLQRMIG